MTSFSINFLSAIFVSYSWRLIFSHFYFYCLTCFSHGNKLTETRKSFYQWSWISSCFVLISSKDHKCKLTTVKKKKKKKWGKELNCKSDYNLNGVDVVFLQCMICKCWEKKIQNIKDFNTSWICPGAKPIKTWIKKSSSNKPTLRDWKTRNMKYHGCWSLQLNGCRNYAVR